MRGGVCWTRATRKRHATALARGDVIGGRAAFLAGAPGAARPALLAAPTLDLRRLLLPPAIPYHAAAEILPSVVAAAADHAPSPSLLSPNRGPIPAYPVLRSISPCPPPCLPRLRNRFDLSMPPNW